MSRAALPAAAAVSWLGLFAHNVLERFPLLSLENAAPAVVAAVLVLWWRSDPAAGAKALLVWGLFQFVGGAIVSVLPLPILPFVPEQTPTHYLAHVIVGAAQLPLLAVAWRERRGAA